MKKLLFILLFALSILPAQAQEGYTVYLPVIYSMADNGWRIIAPQATSNYVLNPSAETTGNFSQVGGATVSRSTTYQKYGLYSYRVQTSGDNEGISLTLSALTNAAHFITVRVRGMLPTSWDWSLDNSLYVTPNFIEKVDGNWNLYGMPVPANIANGQTTLYIRQNGSGSGDFYLDGVQVEPLSTWTDYIDGTQEGCEWLGTAHAAISQRSAQSKAGGISYDLFEKYGFFVEKVVGAGSASVEVGIDSYAILPGGEFNNEKVEPRDWTIVGRFEADTPEKLHANRQALRSVFLILGTQGTRLRYNKAAVQKEITAYYRGGLEGDLPAFYDNKYLDSDEWVTTKKFVEQATIQLVSPDPYWYEVGESAELLDTADSATFNNLMARLRSTGQWYNFGAPSGGFTQINAITEDKTYIYIGGNFTNFAGIANADYIVRWHKINQAFSALSTGMNGPVEDLAVSPDGTLYAVGNFTTAGGGTARAVASWNGSSWSDLDQGVPLASSPEIFAVTIGSDGTVYVTGSFTAIGSGPTAAVAIAAWDGSSWSALGSGLNDVGYALATALNGDIIVGGDFTTAGGTSASRIARWNGSSFSAMSSGMNGRVEDIAMDPHTGTIYAGGYFTTAGGNTVNRVAQWTGASWVSMAGGMDDIVFRLKFGPDSALYAAGQFTTAGGTELADKLARWNGSAWTHLDVNLPSSSSAIFALYVSRYSDPVYNRLYDIFVGWDANGTGTYGGLVTVANEGNVPVKPRVTWGRSGGTEAVIKTLRNENTGREISLNYALQDGESLVMDLASQRQSIYNLPFLAPKPGAVFANSDRGSWVLEPGDNNVTSFVDTDATVTAHLLWRDTYDGLD